MRDALRLQMMEFGRTPQQVGGRPAACRPYWLRWWKGADKAAGRAVGGAGMRQLNSAGPSFYAECLPASVDAQSATPVLDFCMHPALATPLPTAAVHPQAPQAPRAGPGRRDGLLWLLRPAHCCRRAPAHQPAHRQTIRCPLHPASQQVHSRGLNWAQCALGLYLFGCGVMTTADTSLPSQLQLAADKCCVRCVPLLISAGRCSSYPARRSGRSGRPCWRSWSRQRQRGSPMAWRCARRVARSCSCWSRQHGTPGRRGGRRPPLRRRAPQRRCRRRWCAQWRPWRCAPRTGGTSWRRAAWTLWQRRCARRSRWWPPRRHRCVGPWPSRQLFRRVAVLLQRRPCLEHC